MEIFVQSLLKSSEIDSHMHTRKSFKDMAPKTCMLTGFYFFSPPQMTTSKWKTSKPRKLRFCVNDIQSNIIANVNRL